MAGTRSPDGVTRYAADDHDLQSYARAQADLAAMRTPRLHDGRDPASRLFIAYFDGTGNDASRSDLGRTNVAELHAATRQASSNDPSLASAYIAGPGTQPGAILALADGARGFSYDARLETMYYEFCTQAGAWLRENPDALISLASVGFSRGAEQAAGFARMVAERGIADVTNAVVTRDEDGLIVRARYPAPPLQAPGQIPQAELLFDPVGTGVPQHRDRRPPPQVLTALQITAEDERRDLFRGSRILDPGVSHGGRFLNVTVGGCHSDIGGSYKEDGLARRSYNLGVDFLNSLSDRPFLPKRHLRPDLDVVHRSLEHSRAYDDDHYRANERRGLPEAQRRGHVEAIGGRPGERRAESRDAEPIDRALDARYPRRPVEIGPVPETPLEFRRNPPAQERSDLQPTAPPRDPLRRTIGLIAEAEVRGDRLQADAALDAYLDSPGGRAFATQVDARIESLRVRLEPVPLPDRSHEPHAPRARTLAI